MQRSMRVKMSRIDYVAICDSRLEVNNAIKVIFRGNVSRISMFMPNTFQRNRIKLR